MLLTKNKPEELKAMTMRLEMHCAVFIPTGARFKYYGDLFTIMKTEFMTTHKWVDCGQLKAFCLALRRNVWTWVADMQAGENGNDEPVYRIFRPQLMFNSVEKEALQKWWTIEDESIIQDFLAEEELENLEDNHTLLTVPQEIYSDDEVDEVPEPKKLKVSRQAIIDGFEDLIAVMV